MNYNDLYSGFKSLFSECTDELHALAQASDVDETDGMHIMFSFVVVPFVLNLLKNDDNGNDNDKLIRAFNYFEEMASSDSADVTEVLEFTVIENLMSNGRSNYNKSKRYMGKHMIACCKRAEQYLQIGE